MSNGEWVVCPLKEAEGIRINGVVLTEAARKMSFVDEGVSIRLPDNRWQGIAQTSFPVFGIEPVKFVKPEPMEFV